MTRTKRLLRLLIVVVVLVASVWYALGNVEFDVLWASILSLNVGWLLLSVAIAVLAHVIRAARWRLLLRHGAGIRLLDLFSATAIGYFMNNLIPRSGEIIRPYVLSRRLGRPFAEVVATVVVERILDGLALVLLFVLLVALVGEEVAELLPGYTATDALLVVSIPIGALVVALVLVLYTSLGDALIGLLSRWLPATFTARLATFLQNFRTGVSLGGPAGGVAITAWSVLLWMAYAAGLWCGFLAFDFGSLYGLGAYAAVALLAIVTVGITVAPTPGAIGIYHTVCKAALVSLFGVPASPAIAYALVMHAVNYLSVMPLGVGFMIRENISISDAARRSVEAER